MSRSTRRTPPRSTVVLVVLTFAPACAGTGTSPGTPDGSALPDQSVETAVVAELPAPSDPDFSGVPSAFQAGHWDGTDGPTGEALFGAVCATCHSVQPPAKAAPPMAMVARRYRESFPAPAEARDAMIRWLSTPAAERSVLPPRAIERFGLMPVQALSATDAGRVVDYVLSLEPRARRSNDPGGMRGHGEGMAHRHRAGGDGCPHMGGG